MYLIIVFVFFGIWLLVAGSDLLRKKKELGRV